MPLSAKIGIGLALLLSTWGLGYLWGPLAFPLGQGALLLLWGLAPWWVIVPALGVAGLLLQETFGPGAWPYLFTFTIFSLVAVIIGPWWRAGRGWFRPLLIAPILLLGPWWILRLLLAYSTLPHDLSWLPPGLLSLVVLWGGMLYLREYQPRRRTYSIGTATTNWKPLQ